MSSKLRLTWITRLLTRMTLAPARSRLRIIAVDCAAKSVGVGRGFVVIAVGIEVVMSTTSVANMVSLPRIVFSRSGTASPAKNSGATRHA